MRVSVIVPCYNAERYLEQAIGSVLCQSKPPAEVIVVDDGSTDESLSVARKFGDRVQVVSQPNRGASHARNHGASLATGDALLFLDADDVLGPHVLEALTAALHRQPGAIAVGPWYCLRKVGDRWVRTSRNSPPRRFGQDDLSAWLTGWFHTPCSVLWSREAYDKAGEWDQRAYVMDDGEIIMRAMARDVPLVSASFGASYYRRLPKEQDSVSDARKTEAGLRSRIYAICQVARAIEEEGKLPRYRAPLAEAFDAISEDCAETHPELHDECLAHAEFFGGSGGFRRVRTTASEILSKVQRAWWRHMPLAAPMATVTEPPEEIQYGLDWHERLPELSYDGGSAPVVSVIIPTYNRADLLGRALDSVLTQTFDEFEILVVDDASTDSTPEVVGSYDDPRVRYIRQKTNSGVGAARNRGLREARGAFIAFLDSDDEWMPEKLLLQVQRFRELSEDVALLYTAVESLSDHGTRRIDRPSHRGDVFMELLTVNVVYTTSGVMIRRNAAEQAGFFDEDAPANEDWDYWIRIARYFEIDYVDEVLMRYAAVSRHSRKSLSLRDDVDARALFYRKYAPDMKRVAVAQKFLLESARRHLVPDSWDPAEARRLLGEAIRLNPFTPDIYIKLLRSLLPRRGYLFLRTRWRQILRWMMKARESKALALEDGSRR